jgi:tetratricopeptide (TPR) repeat protein
MTNDASLISVACQGLQMDGSDEAVSMLTEAFEKSDNNTTWSYVANALSALGTPEAQTALQKGRDSNNPNKSSYANNALRNLRQRSPGYQYIYQAQQFVNQQQWKEALDQYAIALELDPQLAEAYAGRAQVLLKQEKPQEAHKDFTKALELDPYNSQAVTGLGIVLVLEGKYEAGITFVEDARKKFTNDVFYAYNTACVYGRALEHLQKNEKIEGRDKKMPEYQEKAIAELKRSVTLGFQDFNWMQKDPDLKSLAEVPEFKQIHTPGGKPAQPGEGAQPAPRIRIRPKL